MPEHTITELLIAGGVILARIYLIYWLVQNLYLFSKLFPKGKVWYVLGLGMYLTYFSFSTLSAEVHIPLKILAISGLGIINHSINLAFLHILKEFNNDSTNK